MFVSAKRLKSESGSMMLQVLTGMSLIGMLSYSVMNYTSTSNQENSRQNSQQDIDAAAQLLSSLTSVPDLCNTHVFLRNNFVRPANAVTGTAPDQELAINIGANTTNRPAWVDGLSGGSLTYVPGRVTDFNIDIDRIVIRNAKLRRTFPNANEVWTGDIVLSSQKRNSAGEFLTAGARTLAEIEMEINAAGQKLNCQTNTSPAAFCRDLGGVYDPDGIPRCLFALPDMSCGSDPDAYIHDIQNGVPVCRTAGNTCANGFYAIGIFDGFLECRRLERQIAVTPAPVVPGPTPPGPTPLPTPLPTLPLPPSPGPGPGPIATGCVWENSSSSVPFGGQDPAGQCTRCTNESDNFFDDCTQTPDGDISGNLLLQPCAAAGLTAQYKTCNSGATTTSTWDYTPYVCVCNVPPVVTQTTGKNCVGGTLQSGTLYSYLPNVTSLKTACFNNGGNCFESRVNSSVVVANVDVELLCFANAGGVDGVAGATEPEDCDAQPLDFCKRFSAEMKP